MQKNYTDADVLRISADIARVRSGDNTVGTEEMKDCVLLSLHCLQAQTGALADHLSQDPYYVMGILAGWYSAQTDYPNFGAEAVRAAGVHIMLAMQEKQWAAAEGAQLEKNLMAAVGQPVTEQ